MRTVWFLLIKEFRQIFRNPTLVRIIFLVPVMQLLILPLAADYEIRNITLAVVDHDRSSASRELVSKIAASTYFLVASAPATYASALRSVEEGDCDIILEIPHGFGRELARDQNTTVMIAANAINGVKAGLGSSYLGAIINEFSGGVLVQHRKVRREGIVVMSVNWFNPQMNYALFMVPGILAVLVTMMGSYMAALNIVREKETGTFEQVNVTPIRKHHFILGKLIPFWILGMVVFTIGLIVGRIAYGVVPEGSIVLLYGFVALFLLSIMGLGLLISTYAATQQQAMFISFFFIMIFILLSGLFTSIESMPAWAQVISRMNPVTYFVEVMRMVILKGSSALDILPQAGAVLIFGVVFTLWAVMNYRKTS